MIIDLTKVERKAVVEAREALHRVVTVVLAGHGIDPEQVDLTDVSESMALSGKFNF